MLQEPIWNCNGKKSDVLRNFIKKRNKRTRWKKSSYGKMVTLIIIALRHDYKFTSLQIDRHYRGTQANYLKILSLN